MTTDSIQPDLLERALSDDRVALARLLTLAERRDPAFPGYHTRLYPKVGRARRIGFTGPPGAGKSTLVEAYAVKRRSVGESIGVVAVDPSSPFTGGALLGDRIRMSRLTLDPGCFVRSMASRGSFGGLARTTDELVDVMDAAGFDRVVVETVGVGQSEVDVARATDTTVVILVPGAGDAVQALKAGLMEIADVLVVNKADRPGVERVVAELEEVLSLRSEHSRVAIVQTVATSGEGLDDLDAAIEEHALSARACGEFESRRAAHLGTKVRRIVEDTLRAEMFGGKGIHSRINEALEEQNGSSPYEIAKDLLAELGLRTGARASGETTDSRRNTGGQPMELT
ncbi:MAG: methylmalonyl Co-A mutase-associated GTPase MeaB [Planctomycetota bacterium]